MQAHNSFRNCTNPTPNTEDDCDCLYTECLNRRPWLSRQDLLVLLRPNMCAINLIWLSSIVIKSPQDSWNYSLLIMSKEVLSSVFFERPHCWSSSSFSLNNQLFNWSNYCARVIGKVWKRVYNTRGQHSPSEGRHRLDQDQVQSYWNDNANRFESIICESEVY